MTDNLPADPRDPSPTFESEELEMADPQDVPSDSRGWAVAAHVSPLVGIYVLGALFIWLIKRDEDSFVEFHSREALNFQLSMLIYGLISALLIIVFVGIVLLFAVGIFSFVMAIIAGIKAASGELYRYPLTMRMVKPHTPKRQA
ncbi:MAG: DUF4870 domain-containing protein [Actinomycetia bacterium]|nr:DUF4870 domain-containing protein [Actinomycetes bacterium]